MIGVVVVLGAAGAIAYSAMGSSYATQQGVRRDQPVPFSHEHHVGGLGIDCRYCHTSVENAATAGMPATIVCLSCHSQLFLDAPALAPLHESARTGRPIHWVRVHDLPDFVYFEHDIHVNKGVACVECHGRVDQMPITWRTASLEMQWCLSCHRDAPRHVRPLNEVLSMAPQKPLTPDEVRQLNRLYHLRDAQALTNCSTCHR